MVFEKGMNDRTQDDTLIDMQDCVTDARGFLLDCRGRFPAFRGAEVTVQSRPPGNDHDIGSAYAIAHP